MDQNGNVALILAARGGHRECLSILLGHGADVDKADAVSIPGGCSIAYLWDVAFIGVAAQRMHCNLLCLCCQL